MAQFLDDRDSVVLWRALVEMVEPHNSRVKTGRSPFAVQTMLRIQYLQQWFYLSARLTEEALHDTPVFREFTKIGQGVARLLDETTRRRDDDSAFAPPAGAP